MKANELLEQIREANLSYLLLAKQLINERNPSEGYTALWELGRLDLTVEALVVDNSVWHPLFEPDELDRAQKRLRDYRYKPTA